MKTVTVRNVTLGSGMPKICLPIIGKTKAELVKEVEKCLTLSCDLIEWRVDHFTDVEDSAKVIEMAKILRELLGETPLLLTFRTAKEGGVHELADNKYFELYHSVIPTGLIDLVDLELFMPAAEVAGTVELAHQSGVAVVMCNHDFDATPAYEEIINRLKMMQAKNADICKIAVMPQSSDDVLTLLKATNDMYHQFADRPLITMSMGQLGAVSRTTGEIFGSAMTFGAAEQTSAPGQISANQLKETLKLFHKKVTI